MPLKIRPGYCYTSGKSTKPEHIALLCHAIEYLVFGWPVLLVNIKY